MKTELLQPTRQTRSGSYLSVAALQGDLKENKRKNKGAMNNSTNIRPFSISHRTSVRNLGIWIAEGKTTTPQLSSRHLLIRCTDGGYFPVRPTRVCRQSRVLA